MTTALATPSNILKKDHNGYWYSIPSAEEESFVQAVESVMRADFMSDEWDEAVDDLNNRFGQYIREDL